jgi:hypothetical protein
MVYGVSKDQKVLKWAPIAKSERRFVLETKQ